jgi:hypothetical protein
MAILARTMRLRLNSGIGALLNRNFSTKLHFVSHKIDRSEGVAFVKSEPAGMKVVRGLCRPNFFLGQPQRKKSPSGWGGSSLRLINPFEFFEPQLAVRALSLCTKWVAWDESGATCIGLAGACRTFSVPAGAEKVTFGRDRQGSGRTIGAA